jgi:hypothetical protein
MRHVQYFEYIYTYTHFSKAITVTSERFFLTIVNTVPRYHIPIYFGSSNQAHVMSLLLII